MKVTEERKEVDEESATRGGVNRGIQRLHVFLTILKEGETKAGRKLRQGARAGIRLAEKKVVKEKHNAGKRGSNMNREVLSVGW